MTSSDTYQLKWHSHSTHMNGSVAALLRSDRFTDVVLCTMDGSQIPAHKFILSSCSVYFNTLFEGQRAVTRMGGMLYVVMPSEISTKALKTLVEYMYKGETTVSNEVLDTVLKAGEVLKIRGLWSQSNDATDSAQTSFDSQSSVTPNYMPIAQLNPKRPDQVEGMMGMQSKITLKKDDKLLKALNSPTVQTPGGPRPMFIGAPKLVFIKTSDGNTQATLRPGAPKGQTILVAPTQRAESPKVTPPPAKPDQESGSDRLPLRVLKPHSREVPLVERKYGKKRKADNNDQGKAKETDKNTEGANTKGSLKEKPIVTKHFSVKTKLQPGPVNNINLQKGINKTITIINSETPSKANSDSSEIQIKEEPDWEASSIEEEERSIAEMFHAEMTVKAEPNDEVDIEEESLLFSPLACELCAEVFTQPAAWVRHVEGHSASDAGAKRRHREGTDDSDESLALLRCDLCQKHFLHPAEWVRHIQSAHTETELAMSNNSAVPMRHNRFTEGVQNKTCTYCKKVCPSHASLLIHMRTHTGERPYVCGLCNKGFNVRSNLMRHLRTLHDQLDEEEEEVEESPPGPSEVKRES